MCCSVREARRGSLLFLYWLGMGGTTSPWLCFGHGERARVLAQDTSVSKHQTLSKAAACWVRAGESAVLYGGQRRSLWASQVGRPRRRPWRAHDGEQRGLARLTIGLRAAGWQCSGESVKWGRQSSDVPSPYGDEYDRGVVLISGGGSTAVLSGPPLLPSRPFSQTW